MPKRLPAAPGRRGASQRACYLTARDRRTGRRTCSGILRPASSYTRVWDRRGARCPRKATRSRRHQSGSRTRRERSPHAQGQDSTQQRPPFGGERRFAPLRQKLPDPPGKGGKRQGEIYHEPVREKVEPYSKGLRHEQEGDGNGAHVGAYPWPSSYRGHDASTRKQDGGKEQVVHGYAERSRAPERACRGIAFDCIIQRLILLLECGKGVGRT